MHRGSLGSKQLSIDEESTLEIEEGESSTENQEVNLTSRRASSSRPRLQRQNSLKMVDETSPGTDDSIPMIGLVRSTPSPEDAPIIAAERSKNQTNLTFTDSDRSTSESLSLSFRSRAHKKVRRTQSLSLEDSNRSENSILQSGSSTNQRVGRRRSSQSHCSNSVVDGVTDSNLKSPERKRQSSDLGKYDKFRIRRRCSLGAYEMGQPMFEFQRRQLLSNVSIRDDVMKQERVEKPKYKVMLIGDSGVGKTALLSRHLDGSWPLEELAEVIPQPIKVEMEKLVIELWDTSGKKEFDKIREFTFARSKVFLACFSVNSRESLDNVLMRWVPVAKGWSKSALVVMVCMKADLGESREEMSSLALQEGKPPELIKPFEWREKAAEFNLPVLDCSATRDVVEFFKDLEGLIDEHFNQNIQFW